MAEQREDILKGSQVEREPEPASDVFENLFKQLATKIEEDENEAEQEIEEIGFEELRRLREEVDSCPIPPSGSVEETPEEVFTGFHYADAEISQPFETLHIDSSPSPPHLVSQSHSPPLPSLSPSPLPPSPRLAEPDEVIVYVAPLPRHSLARITEVARDEENVEPSITTGIMTSNPTTASTSSPSPPEPPPTSVVDIISTQSSIPIDEPCERPMPLSEDQHTPLGTSNESSVTQEEDNEDEAFLWDDSSPEKSDSESLGDNMGMAVDDTDVDAMKSFAERMTKSSKWVSFGDSEDESQGVIERGSNGEDDDEIEDASEGDEDEIEDASETDEGEIEDASEKDEGEIECVIEGGVDPESDDELQDTTKRKRGRKQRKKWRQPIMDEEEYFDLEDELYKILDARQGRSDLLPEVRNAAARKKDRDYLPLDLQQQWDRDRQKKAENKRARALKRQEIAADPFSQKQGGKKSQKAALAAAKKFDPSHDLAWAEGQIRIFLEDMNERQTMSLPPMDKAKRKLVHEMALAFQLKSHSRGFGEGTRYTILTKTMRSGTQIDEKKIRRLLRIGGHYRPTRVTQREGDIIGQAAPKIGETNIGFKLLTSMGWSEGDSIGMSGGLEAPLAAVMKHSKLGLGAKKAPRNNEEYS